MTELLRRLTWPLPWWYLLVPAVAVLGITLGSTWEMLSWPYQEWQFTNAQFHQQTAWVAPLSATVAAIVAGKLTAPSRIFALPPATASEHPPLDATSSSSAAPSSAPMCWAWPHWSSSPSSTPTSAGRTCSSWPAGFSA